MKVLEQTTTNEARAVALLRALANPVRFRIVQVLAARRECVVGDLVEAFPLAQSTISEHLKVLKDAGIVTGTIEGPNRCYCIDPAALRFLSETLQSLSTEACCT